MIFEPELVEKALAGDDTIQGGDGRDTVRGGDPVEKRRLRAPG